ncbi:hypothetical protein B11Cv2_004970 [Bartonella sp. 1-1C]|nr:hypothetical protein B11Cv2_004970 [Bartonella sp. 1-1C]CBI80996.1 hypothetical protein B11C_110607 [Bartonella sp. 1-1C]
MSLNVQAMRKPFLIIIIFYCDMSSNAKQSLKLAFFVDERLKKVVMLLQLFRREDLDNNPILLFIFNFYGSKHF